MQSDDPAGHAFADVVVGIAFELELHAVADERSEALACGAREVELNRPFRQSRLAVAPSHLTREHGADRAVDVAQRE